MVHRGFVRTTRAQPCDFASSAYWLGGGEGGGTEDGKSGEGGGGMEM